MMPDTRYRAKHFENRYVFVFQMQTEGFFNYFKKNLKLNAFILGAKRSSQSAERILVARCIRPKSYRRNLDETTPLISRPYSLNYGYLVQSRRETSRLRSRQVNAPSSFSKLATCIQIQIANKFLIAIFVHTISVDIWPGLVLMCLPNLN